MFSLLKIIFFLGISSWPKSSTGEDLPGARLVSNKLNPLGTFIDDKHTTGLVPFGQFISHDCSLTINNPQIGE